VLDGRKITGAENTAHKGCNEDMGFETHARL
jgi:hypothetical protein